MDIGSLCKHDVVTVLASATLQDAARLMRERHVGALVVTSAAGAGAKVLGLVTDRDLVVDAMARGADASTTPVSGLVSGQTVAVPDAMGLSEAIATMRRAGVRRLLVTTPQRRLAGVVSLDDLLVACAGDLQALSETVRHGFAREAELKRPLRDDGIAPMDLSIDEPAARWQQTMQP